MSGMSTRAIQVIASAAIGAGILTGCSVAADEPAQPTAMAGMPGMAGAAQPTAMEAPVATDTVAIENFAYSPPTVTVKAGTTVTWTNRDQDPHTVTATNGGPFHSPTLNNGESFRFTFTQPGRFDYLCTIHPFMTATVVVTP